MLLCTSLLIYLPDFNRIYFVENTDGKQGTIFLSSSSVIVICRYTNWLELVSRMLNSSTMYFSVIYNLINE